MLLCVLNKAKERYKQIESWDIISVLERRMREIKIPSLFSGRVAQLRQRVKSSVDNALIFV